ncbi:hypothetical protein [Flavobacterium urocaniciphilum]|uniref:Outer membrane protein beta-barrel domain-containing protein n=1 Tax=Flavobacterium urocaniciphilum TaxID=1299341 RepID=A0A1H8ZFC4_9FLAO|nr:hypothetical protein [Flavobacterium urocaniciphilum]SEP63093.1 hypothetical protein SAMN05444005_101679 [Flavobacterium urocaniciphilum]
MKKTLLFAFLLLGTVFAQAQDISKNALGLRLGDNDGFGGEISYQRGLSKNNRLEFDLGWRNSNHVDAIKLAGLYQWVWNIDGGFNWYAGLGGGIGSWSAEDYYIGNDKYKGDSETVIFAAGDIGIEYNFDIPLQLSLDFRPEFYFNDGINDDFGPDIALGIRYRWN